MQSFGAASPLLLLSELSLKKREPPDAIASGGSLFFLDVSR
jgi:hypothetical protein